MIQRLLPFFLLGALALGGCATVDTPRIPSDALPAAQSSFGRSIQAQAAPYQGRSGFRLLSNSTEAFMARAELIRNARTSLDLQYYRPRRHQHPNACRGVAQSGGSRRARAHPAR